MKGAWSSCAVSIALILLAAPALAEGDWITHTAHAGPDDGKAQVSLQFRRDFSLDALPDTLAVSLSADNRYMLFVNGSRIDAGPARGDLTHWRFRRIDLAPFLREGDNVVAVQVWNDGPAAGLSQVSARTGFWLEATDPRFAFLDSGPDWQVRVDFSRTAAPAQPSLSQQLPGKYFAAPPPETHDASLSRPAWANLGRPLEDWRAAVSALAAGENAPWTLVEDRLPAMRRTAADGGRLVLSAGIGPTAFPAEPLTVLPDSEIVVRLDIGAMRAGYPRLITSGGAGARVDITYAEAPYGPDRNYLPDRGDGASGRILGLTDHFLPSGGEGEVFAPFWWRAWRYAELRVKTASAPLTLESFDRVLIGYPFDTVARFSSDDPELDRIWRIGWDTVQLDAHETFMDTAYWEQLQYVGDTRIQALVSYAVSGDPRLAAQAIEAFASSRRDGLIQSRHPASEYQSIPPFALLWVGMLHDYWMRQPDPQPVRQSLDAMRSSLDWYAGYVQPDGLVGTTPGWEFIDWRDGLVNYPETKDPRDTKRCIISLMYLGALRQAADLEAALGDAALAAQFRERAAPLPAAIRQECWSPQRGLYADQPARTSFSQHANVLAVLYDVAPPAERQAILGRALAEGRWPDAPAGITSTTYYFAFYLARALVHAGLGDRYLEMLAPWRSMLAQNFTTWPEEADPTRSDSHAWSAHPTFDLLTIVAGIDTAAPGFRELRIEPRLGPLKRLAATYAHPAGPINVDYLLQPNGSLLAEVDIPSGLVGTFAWHGHDRRLAPGRNLIEIRAGAGDGVGAEPE